MTNLSLFLAHGGRDLWQTEEAVVSEAQLKDEYLLPNGLIPKRMHIQKDILYVEIDREKTNMKDFYTWEEAYKHPQKPECWRSFYFFQDRIGADWFSPKHMKGEGEIEGVSIQIYYEDILRHFTN